MLDNIPEDMKGGSATTAANHLFDIAEEATKLSRNNAEFIHHFCATIIPVKDSSSIHIAGSVIPM